MTDPLSVTASIVALLKFSAKVIGYLNDVKNGSEDRGKVLSEIASVNCMLYSLQEKAHEDKQNDAWSSTFQSLDLPKGPLDQIRTALESLSRRLAPPSNSLKKARKAMTWPFQKGEIKDILERIERAKALLNVARQNDHIKLSRAIKDGISIMRDEVEEVAKGVSRIQISQISSSSPKGEVKSLFEFFEHQKIMQWLDAADPSTNYNKALKVRNPRTGSWFIESSTYADWKATRGSFLWLHGIPGCGKTILSSTILENVLEQYSEKSNSAVLFFYFEFNAPEKQRHEKMIRSLICQLSKQSKNPVLQNLYSSCSNGGRQPPGEYLLNTLHQMMTSVGSTYIILDALDECEDRHELFTNLEQIVSWEDVNLHVLVTSRRETDIDEALTPLSSSRNRMRIQSTLVNADIRTYVHDRLQVDRKLKRWQKDLNMQREIEDTLMEKADGMFRWVACQLDLLGDCFSVRQLRQALASLPKTLDDTYARILVNIDKQHNHCYREVLKILQWLTFADRPLYLVELAEIVAIDIDETPRFDPERRWPEPRDILTICSSLVTLTTDFDDANDEESDTQYSEEERDGHETQEEHDTGFDTNSDERDTDSMVEASDSEGSMISVRLAHFSVKEYLVSDRIQHGIAERYSIREIESHGVLAQDCIAYLLQHPKPSPWLRSPGLSALASYAAKHWTYHARQAQKGTVGSAARLSMELLMSGEGGFLKWIRDANPDPYGCQGSYLELGDLASPLYYASLVGLSEPVNMIIEKKVDVNAKGGYYGNALQAALFLGNTAIVQALLDNGADPDAMGRFGTALCGFCYAGNYEAAELVLNKGADVDAYGEGEFNHGTALQIASRHGHEDIVKLLLDRDAGINATSKQNGASSLEIASLEGHESIVKMLLDKGAAVNTRRNGDSALQSASWKGHKNVVEMLLDKGADVNTQKDEVSALQCASREGHEIIVKMLLKKGADVNATSSSDDGTALEIASLKGNKDIVKLLLDRGAYVDTQRNGVSVLQIASWKGDEIVVEMLLEKGADIDAQGDLGSALQRASLCGHESVVKMLLEKGADVNATNPGEDRTALLLATERGHEDVVKMLLERGADVNTWSPRFGRTALHNAMLGGHENIIRMLVGKGADVSALDMWQFSALQIALRNADERLIELLLEKGADINHQGGESGSALQCASRNGHENVVNILLDGGADVNAHGHLETALQLASQSGYEDMVKILLEKGADVNATSPGARRNALQLAIKGGYKEIVEMLLAKGAMMPEEYETSEEEYEEDEDEIGDCESEQDVDPPEQELEEPEPRTPPAVAG